MAFYPIQPLAYPQKATISKLPLSKSISNRALIIHYLSKGLVETGELSKAEDTQLLQKLLKSILQHATPDVCELHCQNAGTVLRFLAACLSVTPGNWLLTGDARMLERPVEQLVDALRNIGADIQYQNRKGYPPIIIKGKELEGGVIFCSNPKSSQYISALLMIAPLTRKGIQIHVENLKSAPYVEMTLKMLEYSGIQTITKKGLYRVLPSVFQKVALPSESDWSSAAFVYELMAISNISEIFINDLFGSELQGDAIVANLFESFGVKTEHATKGVKLIKTSQKVGRYSADCSHFPDLVPALVCTLAALHIPAVLTGLQSLVIKESNRLLALKTELEKMGAKLQVVDNHSIKLLEGINPNYLTEPKLFTYQDHRLVMAFAPLALVYGKIWVENIHEVRKSFPEYWNLISPFLNIDNKLIIS